MILSTTRQSLQCPRQILYGAAAMHTEFLEEGISRVITKKTKKVEPCFSESSQKGGIAAGR